MSMKRDLFCLGLYEHRLWGYILTPYMIRKSDEGNFYITSHAVFPDTADNGYNELSEKEKEAVRYCHEYSDQNLYKLFSKNRNLKEFQEKVEPGRITNLIRPFIEKRIALIFSLLPSSNIRVFYRDKARSNIFEEDFLKTSESPAIPNFTCEKLSEGTRYSLELHRNGKKLSLIDPFAAVLSDFPAILLLNRTLVYVKNIEGKKVRPFFTRESISVHPSAETRYYKSFIMGLVRDFDVIAKGFDIEVKKEAGKAKLSLETGLDMKSMLALRFSYGNHLIQANNSLSSFVEFFRENESFRFEKSLRDPVFEEKIRSILVSAGYRTTDGFIYKLEADNGDPDGLNYRLLESINRHADLFSENDIVFEQDVKEHSYYCGPVSLDIKRTGFQNDWFDLQAVVRLNDFSIPFHRFRKNILNNIREFILPDGKVFILPAEWFSRYREVFEFGKTEGDSVRIHKQHFFILEKTEMPASKNRIKKLDKLNRSGKLPLAELPESFAGTLRSYQHEGYTWLLYLQNQKLGGCLADDMGLGKTVQAIALLLKNKEDHRLEKTSENSSGQQLELFSIPRAGLTSLIIVPASLVHNWTNEIRKFAPSLKVCVHSGNQRNKNTLRFSGFDIIVSSYHTVRQDIGLFSEIPFHYIILDESQVIKNPLSKIYKSIESLHSEHRLALTGTPIENSLIDLWTQMNFVNSGLLGSLPFFKKEFAIPIEKKNQQDKEQKLKTLINPFILRRKKEEVAFELPPVSEQVIYCSMTEEQRKFYETEKSQIRNSIFEKVDDLGLEKSSIIVLQGLTRLRQIANHPVLVNEDYNHDSGKYEEIIRNIENVISEGHKVLVFSSFVKHLELVRSALLENGIQFTLLTGESTKREEIIRSFQDHPECKVFLISLKAGGTGLNLTAADYVFILDPWWNPASESQAMGRSHRIGQKKNVFVYRFISENSIEEKIKLLQERKSKLADSFIHSNNPMQEISRGDLEELFS